MKRPARQHPRPSTFLETTLGPHETSGGSQALRDCIHSPHMSTAVALEEILMIIANLVMQIVPPQNQPVDGASEALATEAAALATGS